MAFWKKGRTPDAANLAAELVKIGSTPKIKGGEVSEPTSVDLRVEEWARTMSGTLATRQVGEELYSLGDRSLDLIRQALEDVVSALGPMAVVGPNVGGQPCPG